MRKFYSKLLTAVGFTLIGAYLASYGCCRIKDYFWDKSHERTVASTLEQKITESQP
jgi:hypothetical protein